MFSASLNKIMMSSQLGSRWAYFKRVFILVEQMTTLEERSRIFNQLKKPLRLGELCRLLESIELRNIKEYSKAISACGRNHEPGVALALIEEMDRKRLHPDMICFSTAIVACQRSGRWQDCCRLLDEMTDRHTNEDRTSNLLFPLSSLPLWTFSLIARTSILVGIGASNQMSCVSTPCLGHVP